MFGNTNLKQGDSMTPHLSKLARTLTAALATSLLALPA
jgi:hypothetical protein